MMYDIRHISEDLDWIGGSDRRLAMFENAFPIPKGVSYNSYLLRDEKTAVLDTVDRSIAELFFENLAQALQGRALDYVIVQHMEPDHAATLRELLARYPDATVVCTAAAAKMIRQFFGGMQPTHLQTVAEGDALSLGQHRLTFHTAPMVHWPEVMVTHDELDGILFSADAFGTFGALSGNILDDTLDFERDWLPEARRYYHNIVGKYGSQVKALLDKASALDVRTICPLHGSVLRRHIASAMNVYGKWCRYEPEEQGVLIVCGSVYGHTQNVADALAGRLSELGVSNIVVRDASVTPSSELLADAFRFSHLVVAAVTYNAGIFTPVESFLHDLKAHNYQNRTVSFIENGSWAPVAANLCRQLLGGCKNLAFTQTTFTIRSSATEEQRKELETMANEINASMNASSPAPEIDPKAMFSLSYGLFVLTAQDGGKDNGCIINTVTQVTSTPNRISICVNKQNLTHDMILHSGRFNVSVLSEDAKFSVFERFGFQSGRVADKFDGLSTVARSANGLPYLTEAVNALLSAKVISTVDCGTHTLFLAEITEARTLSAAPSVTYAYYFANIKPKPQPKQKRGFVCKICGYFYEGDTLPDDFVCPLCKHGAADFEPVGF